MDKLRTLEFFVSVSERGSFVETAKVFGTSPSTISKAIARLEKDLSIQLFTRTTRALSLTQSGRVYLSTVKRLLTELSDSEFTLANQAKEVSGKLKINVPMSYGRLYIRPLIKDFCDRYPNITIEVVYDDTYVDLIEQGIDITFRSGTLIDNRLVARKLSPIDFLICAPKGYFTEDNKPTYPEETLNHPWVNFRFKQTGKLMPVMIKDTISQKYQEHFPSSICIIDDGDALAELCADGLGLAQMPHFIARRWILDGSIEALFPPYSTENIGVFALYTKANRTPLKVKAFLDFTQDWLASIGESANTTWARELYKK